MTCKHSPLRLTYDIERLSETPGGPAKVFAIYGNAMCLDCKTDFRVFKVRLEPEAIPGSALAAAPCEHLNFETGCAIDHMAARLMQNVTGFRSTLVVTANVRCYDCGMKFKPVQFELEPVEKETDLIIPTDEELALIGKEAVH